MSPMTGMDHRLFAPAKAPDHFDLQAKMDLKEQCVRQIIINITKALQGGSSKDAEYLQELAVDENTFRVLATMLTSSKYEVYTRLRCRVMRCMHQIIRLALSRVPSEQRDHPNLGMWVFKNLAGDELARKAYKQILSAVLEIYETHEDALISSTALVLLSELGKDALDHPEVHKRILDLLADCPERLGETVDVALELCSYQTVRPGFLQEVMTYRNGNPGRHMGEALIQIINRSEVRSVRAAKVITSCLQSPQGASFLFTNDAQVLVEILSRNLSACRQDAEKFGAYVSCLKALYMCYPKLTQHAREFTCRS